MSNHKGNHCVQMKFIYIYLNNYNIIESKSTINDYNMTMVYNFLLERMR